MKQGNSENRQTVTTAEQMKQALISILQGFTEADKEKLKKLLHYIDVLIIAG